LKVTLSVSAAFFILNHFMLSLSDVRYTLYHGPEDPFWDLENAFVGGLHPYRYALGYQFPIGLVLAFDDLLTKEKYRWLHLALCLVFAIAMLLLLERTGILVIIPLIITAWIRLRRKMNKIKRLGLIFTTLLIFIIIGYLAQYFFYLFPVMAGHEKFIEGKLQKESMTEDIRVHQHRFMLNFLLNYPIGVTIEQKTWEDVASKNTDTCDYDLTGNFTPPHDAYLIPLIDYGFLGLLILIAYFLAFFHFYYRLLLFEEGAVSHVCNAWLAVILYSFLHSDGITNYFKFSMIIHTIFIGSYYRVILRKQLCTQTEMHEKAEQATGHPALTELTQT
jgi:O-antigen ligase